MTVHSTGFVATNEHTPLRRLIQAERARPHDLRVARDAVELEGKMAMRATMIGR
jgi:hypothetical protein